jgi:deoxyribose-phosphate aldolase
MESIKDIAIRVFHLVDPKPCHCSGAHEVCLHCRMCHHGRPPVEVDVDNPAPYIDHTLLRPDALPREIDTLCAEAEKHGFASVCVNPLFIKSAASALKSVPACSVIGFPLGSHLTQTKVSECVEAICDGASEIDMVIAQGLLKAGLYAEVENDIAAVVVACRNHGALLKVIQENCNLTDEEKVIACLLSKHAGAEYVKTSTGFGSGGATEHDVRLMRSVVGPHLGVKAAGGIRDRATAQAMLRAGADRIGSSKSLAIIEAEE